MSLIQQALEKTSRAQETRTTTPAPAIKPWSRDPLGAQLEQDLVRVQQAYVRRRSLYWKVALGVLSLLVFVAGLFYIVGIPRIQSSAKVPPAAPVAVSVTPQSPIKIYSGNIFRLTGIMNLGNKPMAMINGNIAGVGDSLAGKAVVKSIGKGDVLLDVQGKEIRLAL